MQNRIEEKMNEIRGQKKKSFSIVLMIGDPTPEITIRDIEIALENGVDILELGIPYANPYLDSKIMKESMERALTWSNDPKDYMDFIKQIRDKFPSVPFEIMVYHETVMKIGIDQFANGLKKAEMDAVLVADYVDRDSEFLEKFDQSLKDSEVIPIRFVPHPYEQTQIDDLKKNGRGFVIAQTIADAEGNRKSISPKNEEKIKTLRESGVMTPIVSAYGIRTPEDIGKCIELGADGVLLGTVVLDAAFNKSQEDFSKFLKSLSDATYY